MVVAVVVAVDIVVVWCGVCLCCSGVVCLRCMCLCLFLSEIDAVRG